jgi:hypothetical protein
MSIDSATTIASALASKNKNSSGDNSASNTTKPHTTSLYRQRGSTSIKKSKKKVKKYRKVSKESIKTITNRLYALWSVIVRTLANHRCEVCGSTGKLDAHHIQPRQICTGLRFDVRNGICLCAQHHKWGHESAHKGMLWFSEWLRTHNPEQYNFVLENRDSELNCKDRLELYNIESNLHYEHSYVVGTLPYFKVTLLLDEGEEVSTIKSAYNKKAAEFIAFSEYKSLGHTVKGIVDISNVQTVQTL